MFCQNCGNQNPDNATCCGYCGAKLATKATTPVTPATPVRDLNGVIGNLQSKANIFLALLVVIALLATIFWFTNTIAATASYNGEKESETATLKEATEDDFEGMSTLFTITTLASTIGTMAVAGLNFVQGKAASGKLNLIVVKIASIIAFLSMLIPIIILKAEYDGEFWGVKMSAGPSFSGIVFMLLSIAMFVVAVLAEKEVKNN